MYNIIFPQYTNRAMRLILEEAAVEEYYVCYV